MATYKQLGFSSYNAYLSSEHWQQFRKKYSESNLQKTCLCCGKEEYQLHHKTYERLGCEYLEDVVPLCDTCHVSVHKHSKKFRIPLQNIQEAIDAVRHAERFVPSWVKMTKRNSTKKQRKAFHKHRRTAKSLAVRERSGLPNQVLIDCQSCGKRGWQDGPYCSLCGSHCLVIRRNPQAIPSLSVMERLG